MASERKPRGPAAWLWRHRHAAGAFVALFAFWELAAWLLTLPPYMLPPPSKILVDLSTR